MFRPSEAMNTLKLVGSIGEIEVQQKPLKVNSGGMGQSVKVVQSPKESMSYKTDQVIHKYLPYLAVVARLFIYVLLDLPSVTIVRIISIFGIVLMAFADNTGGKSLFASTSLNLSAENRKRKCLGKILLLLMYVPLLIENVDSSKQKDASDLKEKIEKLEIEQKECIPKNIRGDFELRFMETNIYGMMINETNFRNGIHVNKYRSASTLQNIQNKSLNHSHQVTLVNTKDTVVPKESHSSGNTPLLMCCCHGYTDMVQWILHNVVDVDQRREMVLLDLALQCRNGIIEITELLLENNADCNICAYSKQTVTETVFRNPSDTLQEYKQSLFDTLVTETSNHVTDYVSSKSVEYAFDVETGSSPLHIACFMEDGTTPLFYACEVGHEDIVRLLLDKGADTQICRLDGKSPLNIATDNGHTSIVKIITEHMEKENPLL
ncbi:unnamed protein product [Mytilus edulis]|uniref:Uncharacterized protein n=1 Tax=Mytilus edulis TaxID=6550 RepID=A0A8S3SZ82_MYTED|nr:unnamed protein product [Mytilus edulis]